MQKTKLTTIYFIVQFLTVMAGVPLAGYYINTNSDAQQNSPAVALSIQDIAPGSFSEFKTSILRPEVLRICLQQISEQFPGDSKPPSFAHDFCDCYVPRVTDAVTRDDMIYMEQFKHPSPDMESRIEAARQSARQLCRT